MFEQIHQVKAILELCETLQSLDADADKKADWQEFLGLGSKLYSQYGDLQDTLNQITRLAGSDIEAIKAKLGVA